MSQSEDEGGAIAPSEVIRTLDEFGEYWPPWLFLLKHRFDELVSPQTEHWLERREAPDEIIEFARLAREEGPEQARDWVVNGLVQQSCAEIQPVRLYALKQIIESVLVLETWEPLSDRAWLTAVQDYRDDASLYYEPAKPLEFFLQLEELYGARAPVQDRVELMLAIGQLYLRMPPDGQWDRAQMVEESIRVLAEAIEETTRSNPAYVDARLHASLGRAYLQRMDADPMQHLLDGKHHLQVAMAIGELDDDCPSEVLAAKDDLVQCYCEIGRLSFDRDERQTALREALKLLEAPNLSAQQDPSLQRAYALALFGEFESQAHSRALAEVEALLAATAGGKPGGIFRSDEWYDHARETNLWAWARFRYAQVCLIARARGYEVDLRRAIEELEGEVASMFDRVSIAELFPAGSELIGDLRAFDGDWQGALDSYVKAEEASNYRPYTIAGREASAAQRAVLGAKKAVCLAHLGDTLGALLASDQHKARGLLADLLLTELGVQVTPSNDGASETGASQIAIRAAVDELREVEALSRLPRRSSLRPSDAELGQRLSESRVKVASLAEEMGVVLDEVGRARVSDLAAIERSGSTVAAIVVAPFGGVVIAARAVTRGINTKWREVPTDTSTCRAMIGSYVALLSDFAAGKTPALDMTIRNVLRGMDDTFGGALRSTIAEVDTPVGGRVAILANEGLAALPWHGLTDRRTDAALGATYALASWPSLRWAANVISRPAQSTRRRLLIVADPTRDLPYAGLEGSLIARLAREAGIEATVLTRRHATASRLTENLRGASHVHVAGHAWADVSVPWRSSVRLADGDLSAATLLARISGDLQVATLSGCETGVSEIGRSPQERTGLTAAFLGADCRAVVSSAWPMADLPSCILMVETYRRLIVEEQPVEEALRGAAEWLRGASRGDVSRWLGDQRLSRTSLRAKTTLWTARWALRRWKGDGPPFASAFHWAGYGAIAAPAVV